MLLLRAVTLLALGSAVVLAAPAAGGIRAALRAQYDAWSPAAWDASPLATLRRQDVPWDTAVPLLNSSLFDDEHAYAELRGGLRLPDGRDTVGVQRAALYRRNAGEALLVVNDEWCAGTCSARSRFVLLRSGKAPLPVADAQVVPALPPSAFLPKSGAPACLRGVKLGVQYVPSRFDTTLTALAVVPDGARAACTKTNVNVALTLRPVRLQWRAAQRDFRTLD
ncbi:hypothetical protein [Deinococcus maricopensis]|uniref:Uncharacterized protein n=1 Tax=Deinococcus maricopensis (strain DSM 21211 / LMG 22137 / NRRL B-23946 / LB-34) TaxID=709986 RepID=E8U7W4_DEIML|nr:hypothetical protein [Deinococcus maricopensis]ADV67153.1 hypothetical protein Deima_1504 [Deinococcus maricopensis DSM 21211]